MVASHKVIIIDDSEDDREFYSRLLHNAAELDGVRAVESGEEGIALHEERRADCILLDYHLPGEDGIEVLKELRALDPYTAIIMLTGQGSEDIAVAAMKAGASDYVIKDTISAVGMRRALKNAVEKCTLRRKIEAQQEEQAKFLQILIHDVKAPLRHISTYSEFLKEDINSKAYDAVPGHLDTIGTAVRRIIGLVDTLALYSFLEGNIEFSPVCMNRIAQVVVGDLADVIKERGAEVLIGPLPTVKGHAPQLIQLLQNLINNGLKYNDGPTPIVSISAVPGDNGVWTFCVTDNGIGIPDRQRIDIFQPFVRLWSRDKYEGTGLGLAICSKIVMRHEGKIWCESNLGEGSRFCFTLLEMAAEPD